MGEKVDVLSDTPFKYPEAPEMNKIGDCSSKSTTVASNFVTPLKEKVPPVVYLPLNTQQISLCNLQNIENSFVQG